MTDTDPEPTPARPFGEWLAEQRSGLLAAELSDALNHLVAAVADIGKAGTLTLVVKVAPAGKNGHTVVVADDIKVKAPEAARSDSIFFVDDDNNLSRHDPRQPTLPLRDIADDSEPAEIRHMPRREFL